MKVFLNLLGIVVVIGLIFLISWDRKNIRWKAVGKAIIAQFVIAILLVKVPVGKMVVSAISDGVTAVINCGQNGLSFVFGSLADSSAPTGSIFIVQTLGNIIFVSALVSLLYYLGVLGFVVKWIGKAVGKLMGTTEVESFVAVANMFLGQTDSPILVSKYIGNLTDSEILVILVSGMGSIHPRRISCTWYPDGISSDRQRTGTGWKYPRCKNVTAADRACTVYHRRKDGQQGQ